MSGKRETPQMNSRNRTRRTAPSTRLNAIWPPRAGLNFFSSVAASSGRYLYMKMKKARDKITLPAASHPLMVAASSRESELADAAKGESVEMGSASLRFGGTAEA